MKEGEWICDPLKFEIAVSGDSSADDIVPGRFRDKLADQAFFK